MKWQYRRGDFCVVVEFLGLGLGFVVLSLCLVVDVWSCNGEGDLEIWKGGCGDFIVGLEVVQKFSGVGVVVGEYLLVKRRIFG